MNKNTITGLLLIVAIFVGYSIITKPSKEELEKRKRKEDSIAQVQQAKADSFRQAQLEEQKLKDTIANNDSEVQAVKDESNAPVTKTDSAKLAETNRKYGDFAISAEGETQYYTLETDLLNVKFQNKGGRIYSVELKKFKTHDHQPLMLFEGDTTKFGLNFFDNNKNISTNELYFIPLYEGRHLEKKHLKVTGDDSLSLTMRLLTDSVLDYNTKYIDFIYTFSGNKYMQSFDIKFKGMEKTLNENTNFVNLEWQQYMEKQEKSLKNERQFSTIYYKFWKDDVDYISESKDDTENLKTKLQWVSFKQRFFASTLISENGFENAVIETITPNSDSLVKFTYANITCEVQDKTRQSIPMKMYFGPMRYNTLSKYHMDLERQIPLGWSFFLMQWINRFAVLPVFNFLEGFNMNYGIIILILTILLKIVLFPIAYRTYKSSAKMRVLKPEIEEIGKKFPKKEDAMKKQQATMGLYKKAGVSPMSGCVPMLLQFPILIALFRFFPASIELRQKSFLWAEDLSSYDSIFSWDAHVPLLSSIYGNHVSLFTLLMTISTIIYTRINNQMMSTNQQMPGMKVMMYMMPVMFLFIFNSYSSGLSYYYFLANIITFAQMFLIRRYIDEDKLRAQIEAHKKKPAKKSAFQKRLEDVQKQRAGQKRKKK